MNSRRSCGIIGASLRPIMGTELAPMMTVPLRSPSKRKKIPSILHFISDSLTTGRAAALRYLSFMGKHLCHYTLFVSKNLCTGRNFKKVILLFTQCAVKPRPLGLGI